MHEALKTGRLCWLFGPYASYMQQSKAAACLPTALNEFRLTNLRCIHLIQSVLSVIEEYEDALCSSVMLYVFVGSRVLYPLNRIARVCSTSFFEPYVTAVQLTGECDGKIFSDKSELDFR